MSYPFTEDHDMIREAARGWLTDWYDGGKGPGRIAESGTGMDDLAWNTFAGEQGMAGIAVDENYGGAGLGDVGRVVVMEELGASLCSIPFYPTGIAADVIAGAGSDDVKGELLPKFAVGDIKSTFAYGNDIVEEQNGRLSGQMHYVADIAHSDLILSSRNKGSGIEIFAIMPGSKGVSIMAEKTMDPTRQFGTLKLDGLSEWQVIGQCEFSTFGSLFDSASIALAAECVGGAQKCLDLTVAYAGQRVQFDRPIASFQAVKHRCADMYIAIEASKSAVYAAATASTDAKHEAGLIAKAMAGDAFFKVAGDAIQMHGGIGFTWEYPLHYFFKRARANRTMFGASDRDYSLVADKLLGDAV